MVARILLVLMLLAGAVPGMAVGVPCHEASPTAMAAMPGMPAHHHDRGAPAEHRCLGCTPLPDLLAARLPVAPARAPLPRTLPVRLDLRAAGPPAAPPPRIG